MTHNDIQLLVAALISVLALVGLIVSRLRLHPLLALLVVCVGVGFATGMAPDNLVKAITNGAGKTLGAVGVVIALGAMLGKVLADTGVTDGLAGVILEKASPSSIPWAMAVVAFIVGIPMFFEVGLVVLLQLRWQAQLVALGSLALIAAYPFMKRITWWPQAWLGLVFTWGALVGWTALRGDRLEVMAALYAGSIFWCIGYDTIYALQDREYDALAGIRSSALRLGENVRGGVLAFYGLALALWALAFWLLREDWIALLALIPAGGHLLWQALTLNPADPANPLDRFRSNRFTGLLVAAACLVVGNA